MEENTTATQQEAEQTEAQAGQAETQARTFTQEEVNKIVADRLKRESAKHSETEATIKAEAETSATELQKANAKADELQAKLDAMTKANEIREMKDKVSAATGVPTSLLTGATEEECKAQADAILAFAKPAYPSVKDGGETTTTPVSKADILAIKDEKARLKAIQEHIDLF